MTSKDIRDGASVPQPTATEPAQGHRTAKGFEDEAAEETPSPKALPDAEEPRTESAAESLGRSISQVLTGGTHENKVVDSSR